jgi:DNA-3-methyladenine glycosylase I
MAEPVLTRCGWAGSELMTRYHDEEWGVVVHDDRTLFEFLCLEGAQAGLSWETVLKKRANYRAALAQFDPAAVARNAKALLTVRDEFGSFDAYLWRFVDGKPVVNARRTMKDIPAQTPLSAALSKDLRKRGFNFVGSTICYAFMQAVGMVNDHLVSCFRHRQVQAAPSRRRR